MDIETGTRVRDCGKVFIAMDRGGDLADARVESRDPEGHLLPACLVDTSCARVLVVGDFSCPQTVTIQTPQQTSTVAVDPMVVGTPRREGLQGSEEDQEAIRDIDRGAVTGESLTNVFAACGARAGKGRAKFYGTCDVEWTVDSYDPDAVDFVLLDEAGREIGGIEKTLMGCHSTTYGDGTRVTQFYLSFDKPQDHDEFTLWVRVADPSVADGLFWVSPGYFHDLCADWERLIRSGGDGPAYGEWVDTIASVDPLTLAVEARAEDRPVDFAVVLLTAGADTDLIRKTLESVEAQTHGRWELLMESADGTLPDLGPWEGKGTMGAFSSAGETPWKRAREALAGHGGAYGVVLEAGDVMAPDFLWEAAAAVMDHDRPALIYSDSDVLVDGVHRDGDLKPDFDPYLFLAHDYLGHGFAFDLDRLLPGTEGSMGELVLAAMDRDLPVHHVEKPLWSRMATAAPSALDAQSADKATDAVAAYMDARVPGTTVTEERGVRQLAVPMASGGDDVMAVVVHDPKPWTPQGSMVEPQEDLRQAVADLMAQTYDGLTSIVVVDGAGDLDAALLEAMGRPGRTVEVVRAPGGTTHGPLYDLGVARGSASNLVLMEEHVGVPDPSTLGRLMASLGYPQVGAVFPAQVYRDGMLRGRDVVLPYDLPQLTDHFFDPDVETPQRKDAAVHRVSCGGYGFMVLTREAFEAVGGFDGRFEVDFGDVDLTFRVDAAGHHLLGVPLAQVVSKGIPRESALYMKGRYGRPNEPTDRDLCLAMARDEGLFYELWSYYIGHGDPFYNRQYIPGLGYSTIYIRYGDGTWSERLEPAR